MDKEKNSGSKSDDIAKRDRALQMMRDKRKIALAATMHDVLLRRKRRRNFCDVGDPFWRSQADTANKNLKRGEIKPLHNVSIIPRRDTFERYIVISCF